MNAQWAKTAIWWSVYPLGACGAPIRTQDQPGPHHRLRLLEGWLDHIIGLGCNGVALGPIWRSSTHGYDIIDHLAIDPRLGDEADFDHLVSQCHQRGIRVLLDGVFNHVSSQHGGIEEVRTHGWDCGAARLFRRDPNRSDGLSRFEGHDGLVELDHSHLEVVDYVTRIMSYWLDRGADGWRLDAAYRVPTEFWAQVLPQVRQTHPDMVTVAEILHGDYAAIGLRAGFDSVTQYELWKAIWSTLANKNPHELVWTLERHDHLRGAILPWTFVSNHDVTRIASQAGLKGARVAAAALMTIPGMPAIYYGDEIAMTGVKEERIGGDDAIRPALPEQPPLLSGEAAETYRLAQLSIQLRRTHPWLVDAACVVTQWDKQRLTWRSTSDDCHWVESTLTVGDEPTVRISDANGELLLV